MGHAVVGRPQWRRLGVAALQPLGGSERWGVFEKEKFNWS